MKKLISLSKDSTIKVNSKIFDYLFPEFVYLKVEENTHFMVTKKKIAKGEKLFSYQGKVICSPVSGTIKNVVSLQGQYYLKILNDFEENDSYAGVLEFTTKALKLDFKSNLEETCMEVAKRLKKKKKLVFNGIEDEPYIANKMFLHKEYTSEILSTLDILAESYHIQDIDLYFKENDRESIEAFSREIGSYPNMEIHILPDVYPIGKEDVFGSYLHLDDSSCVLVSEEVMEIYEQVIKRRVEDSMLVTLTGDAIHNPMVVRVKIGTPLKEVVTELLRIKKGKYEVFANGLMNGTKISVDDFILDKDSRAIYFMKEKNIEEQDCIACGKCIEVCPVKCNPYRSYLTRGKYENKNCLHCGLCTFICPSYIHLENYLRRKES